MPSTALYILFGALLTCFCVYSAGSLALHFRPLPLRRQEEVFFRFVVGVALLSLWIFLLAICRVALKGVFVASAVLLAAAFWRTGAWRLSGESLPETPRWGRWAFIAVYLAFGVVYLVNALAPEMSPDGATYHLGLVSRYYRAHGFAKITNDMYANLSQAVELLFLQSWAFGRHSAAALTHSAFLFMLPWGMIAYARRAGFARAGFGAALLLFAAPVVGIDGTSAYNDVAVAAAVFGVFYLVEIWRETLDRRLLPYIGLVAGLCYGIKYTAGLAVAYALGVVAWTLWRKPEARAVSGHGLARALLVISLAAAVPVAPWMIKNAVWIGNPVSPFFNRLFPNATVDPQFESTYSSHMRHFNQKNLSDAPLEVTVRGHMLGGLIGPVFLLLPLSLLALRSQAGRRVLLAALLFSAVYPLNIGTRFLIMALPLWSLALAMALDRWMPALVLVVSAHAVLSWPWVMPRYCERWAWRLSEFPWQAALRIEPEEVFLAEHNNGYKLARLVEQNVPPGEKVFTFGQHVAEAYTAREIVVGHHSTMNVRFIDAMLTALEEDRRPTWRLEFRIPAARARAIRVVQTAWHDADNWSVTELHVLRAGQPLPREARWRVRADPNPFEVQSAFDNDPVTRWSSRAPIRPGMFVEMDFGGQAVELDAVRLDCSRDQYQIRLKLEIQDEQGRWKAIESPPADERVAVRVDLRAGAVRALKSAGINYALIADWDHKHEDYAEKTWMWRMQLVEANHGGRLYRLE